MSIVGIVSLSAVGSPAGVLKAIVGMSGTAPMLVREGAAGEFHATLTVGGA
jgi:hypothetical protein